MNENNSNFTQTIVVQEILLIFPGPPKCQRKTSGSQGNVRISKTKEGEAKGDLDGSLKYQRGREITLILHGIDWSG